MLEPHTAGRCKGTPVCDLSVESFLSRCLLLDLEVGRDQRIYHVGALLGDKVLERKGPMGPGILRKLDTMAIAKAACFCIRPNHDLVSSEYLALQLASQDTHNVLIDGFHCAIRPRITTKRLRGSAVRVCSPGEQWEIVRRGEALFSLADAVEKRVVQAKQHVEKTTQAILAKAFRGELVPTTRGTWMLGELGREPRDGSRDEDRRINE
jgi:hypothetical protein